MPDTVNCSRSTKSGKLVFPEIPTDSPVKALFEPATVANHATLYSYTTIHPNPKAGLPPFSLGYADFGDELRVFGKLSPDAKPVIGMALCLEPQADAEAGPAYLFVPIKA